MNIIVGYTGFVGSNLCLQHKFDGLYNSKNITKAYGSNPDLCVYAGIRSEKFSADRFPEQDLCHIHDAIDNIHKINPKKLVLISTVDVISFPRMNEAFEDTELRADTLTPYGQNRLILENELRKNYPAMTVIRLPALFGPGLKKNFIFDLIQFIPAMLKKEKLSELSVKSRQLSSFYREDETGFFRLRPDLSVSDKATLKALFENIGFSALNFTDSRSKFAFYNLKYLWAHIDLLLNNDVTLAHIATEAVFAQEVLRAVADKGFTNEIMPAPFDYTLFKTRYARLLGGKNGYIFDKKQILSELAAFIGKNLKGE